MGLRVVITGATGNVGTALSRALATDDGVDDVLGLARRIQCVRVDIPKLRLRHADVTESDLTELFDGADAVVHLAWELQPAHDLARLHRTNVIGSNRVLESAAAAGVGRVVVASSVGAYAAGPKDRCITEEWPATGIPSSTYSRHKAALEQLCDRFADRVHLVRLRPALIFQASSALEQRRLFVGRLLPTWPWRRRLWPVAPWLRGVRFQAVHADDVADAYRRALHTDAAGAFNIAAEPIVDAAQVRAAVGARIVEVPPAAVRPLHSIGFRLHAVASEPGWLDLATLSPVMASGRARDVLGWTPRHSSTAALEELALGLRSHAEGGTPALAGDPR
jgi:UDP-glucose 4-epimerase